MRWFPRALCAMASTAALLVVPLPHAAADDTGSDDGADVCGEPPSSRFDDARGNVHEAAIVCLDGHGIADGFDGSTFGPAQEVTRGQMAAFVARTLQRAGVPLSDDHAGFADTGGTTHEAAIVRLAAEAIVEGVGDDRYAPARSIRRDQMATFLARGAETGRGEELPAGSRTFTDIDSSVHAERIDAAAAAGLVRGVTADRYEPAPAVTRDRMAAFLTRLLQDLADAGRDVPQPDYDEAGQADDETAGDEEAEAETTGQTFEGEASWYGSDFAGQQTACGEIFDPNEMTAAHLELPCGTEVRVTNTSTGQQAVVRINDRGPYAGNRVLDVSERAARELGFHGEGTTWVRGEVLE
jgi:hypothetical protein